MRRLFQIYRLLDIRSVGLWNAMAIPFAILHLRHIQSKYQRYTEASWGAASNENLARLRLLQSWEEYYKQQFDSWGKYHGRFSYDDITNKIHKNNMLWLFPKKNFKEQELVILYSHDAVKYYKNKIYTLSNGKPPHYVNAIKKQIEETKSL